VAVFLPSRIATCFIGDPCAPGTDGCIGLRNDQGELVEGFTFDSMAAVRTSSPARETAAKEVCVEMVTTPAERDEILFEIQTFRDNVQRWSRGDVVLELRLIEFERLDMDESRWDAGVWIGPWDLTDFALPRLDFVPDFNLVVPPIRDPVLGLHHDLGGCGGAFGADLGILGAGWNWVPKTATSFGFECANQLVFVHEWLHQVEFAWYFMSGFTDLYGGALPACGAGDPDARRWFPNVHQCAEDPDFPSCGTNECPDGDAWHEHILSMHWDPVVRFVANHCKDGFQDFDETDVDVGPTCRAAEMPPEGIPAAATPAP
jgi:hypothetical protein